MAHPPNPAPAAASKISKIAIKSETFCTTWNQKLYCIDICEDAEERNAWLYRSDCGYKSFMFGEKVEDDRNEFLNAVFSNLPDYIEDYEADMKMFEKAFMMSYGELDD